MDTPKKSEQRTPVRARIVTIHKQKYEVVSFFDGKETLEDILKRRILKEYEQRIHTYC
jgi:hypothetical protein